eukprot:CAMPEP_0195528334 /NCGR_PEP_ID=MMETSP0794_2-20130614/30421_1 /TAXON_ID=515487 /ORGANISM="Stephanopyxis turris, Strain CCMP 815" /LENGTH=491 /DNA_ID=CAMNT_0040659455 /DNA_START=557 /DNA_END=2032 /DNA_ORIENTATION=-
MGGQYGLPFQHDSSIPSLPPMMSQHYPTAAAPIPTSKTALSSWKPDSHFGSQQEQRSTLEYSSPFMHPNHTDQQRQQLQMNPTNAATTGGLYHPDPQGGREDLANSPHLSRDHQQYQKNYKDPPSAEVGATFAFAKRIKNIPISNTERQSTPEVERYEDSEAVVFEEDRSLLTDYIFFIHQQLKMCRFSEADRKARGGNRDHVKIGYGGLQCRHCADNYESRKFYWSNVDRLANSFAEISSHIAKCISCPDEIKDRAKKLKLDHQKQMSKLPRGSQKVFFRRMWRRIHDGSAVVEKEISPDSAGTEEGGRGNIGGNERNETSRKRVLLSIAEDKAWLSDLDCFIRRSLEVFCASDEDFDETDRKPRVRAGQIGIRCVHCASSKEGAKGAAVTFPTSISKIYESVQGLQRHLHLCSNLPNEEKKKWSSTMKTSKSLGSVVKRYYIIAAKSLGLYDTGDCIRSRGGSFFLSQSVSPDFASLQSGKREANEGDD